MAFPEFGVEIVHSSSAAWFQDQCRLSANSASASMPSIFGPMVNAFGTLNSSPTRRRQIGWCWQILFHSTGKAVPGCYPLLRFQLDIMTFLSTLRCRIAAADEPYFFPNRRTDRNSARRFGVVLGHAILRSSSASNDAGNDQLALSLSSAGTMYQGV